MEESGKCRRGYFVEGLGGAQFASPGAVDRLRALANAEAGDAVLLSATDPANPYGAALPWPDRGDGEGDGSAGHRPGRKAGARVVLVGGSLALYVEKGGRSLLTFGGDAASHATAVTSLAAGVRAAGLGRILVERVDGNEVFGSILAGALAVAGFRETPRGMALRP